MIPFTFDTVKDAANITEKNCQAYYSDGDTYIISASRSDVKGENSIMNIYKFENNMLSPAQSLTNNTFNTKNLLISDYSILEQMIFLLDSTNGIY